MDLAQALQLFGLTNADLGMPSGSLCQRLQEKRQELLLTWHPHRYANLTNNPKKYMKMYKQGEEKTKEITAAYEILAALIEKKED